MGHAGRWLHRFQGVRRSLSRALPSVRHAAREHHRASTDCASVALAKRGQALMGGMIVADIPGKRPAEYDAALREQQRVDLERGLAYAKNVPGVGERWRS